MTKELFMKEAIKEAYKGIKNKEGGPFGCVIVKDNKIIGRGYNQVISKSDCTCHGEIQAIRDACKTIGSFDLSSCELYTTAQACPMCSGAIQWARISKVYQGCNYLDTEKIGFSDKEFFESAVNAEEVNREDCKKLFEDYLKMDHKLY